MEKMTLPGWMTEPGNAPFKPCGKSSAGFVGRSLETFASVLVKAYAAPEASARDGLVQGLDPRASLAGFFFLILAAAFSRSWVFILALIALTMGLSVVTKSGAWPLLRRTLPAVVFTAVLAAPVVFDFVTPGAALFELGGLAVTAEGVKTALFFVLRVASMAALASLAALNVSQAGFFRGLGGLLPSFFVTALFFTFRYAFLLVKAAIDMAMAKKSRTICHGGVLEGQRWSSSRAAFILKRSQTLADEVSMALASRGFDGRVRAYPAGRLGFGDFLWLGAASFVFFLSFGF